MKARPAAVVRTPYGRGSIEVRLPEANLAGVLAPNTVPRQDPDEVLAQALDNPVDGLEIGRAHV